MIYEFQCLNGHSRDVFEHSTDDLGCETIICECGHSMSPVPAFGKGIAWFEEGRARVIYNLGHEPVTITSYAQHKAAMKKAGVVEAGERIGRKGCWV